GGRTRQKRRGHLAAALSPAVSPSIATNHGEADRNRLRISGGGSAEALPSVTTAASAPAPARSTRPRVRPPSPRGGGRGGPARGSGNRPGGQGCDSLRRTSVVCHPAGGS